MTEWVFSNQAASTLREALASGDTVVKVEVGFGGLFPQLAVGQKCKLVLEDRRTGAFEIVDVIARNGDDLTVVRAVEQTQLRAWPAGTHVSNRFTAEVLNDVFPVIGPLQTEVSNLTALMSTVSPQVTANTTNITALQGNDSSQDTQIQAILATQQALQAVVGAPTASDVGKSIVVQGAGVGGYMPVMHVVDTAFTGDLDTVDVASGIYIVGASISGGWSGIGEQDVVFHVSGPTVRMQVGYSTQDATNPRTWSRVHRGGTWGPWVSNFTNLDIATAAEAVDTSITDKLMTPSSTSVAVRNAGWSRVDYTSVAGAQYTSPVLDLDKEYMLFVDQLRPSTNNVTLDFYITVGNSSLKMSTVAVNSNVRAYGVLEVLGQIEDLKMRYARSVVGVVGPPTGVHRIITPSQVTRALILAASGTTPEVTQFLVSFSGGSILSGEVTLLSRPIGS